MERNFMNLLGSGENIERKARDIFIENIELLNFSENIIRYKVTCSKGTYIRVLSEDIAEKLIELYSKRAIAVGIFPTSISSSLKVNSK